jgi:hypothetical protein
MAAELADLDAPMELVLRPASVFQLCALVQLACRHPGVTGPMRETSEAFLAGVREYFAACPAVLDVVRRGDDPSEDR